MNLKVNLHKDDILLIKLPLFNNTSSLRKALCIVEDEVGWDPGTSVRFHFFTNRVLVALQKTFPIWAECQYSL